MEITTYKDPTVNMRALLLDEVAAPTSGEWCLTEGFDKFSIHIIISNTATVQVYVCNKPSPANADDYVKVGNDISASALVEIKVPVRYIKVKVTSVSSGNVSAYLEAV